MLTQIRSPISTFYSGLASSISFESPDGEVQILPNHCSMLSIISTGIIFVEDNQGNIKSIFADSGICLVKPDHQVEIFCTGVIDIKTQGIESIKKKMQLMINDSSTNNTNKIGQYEKAILKLQNA